MTRQLANSLTSRSEANSPHLIQQMIAGRALIDSPNAVLSLAQAITFELWAKLSSLQAQVIAAIPAFERNIAVQLRPCVNRCITPKTRTQIVEALSTRALCKMNGSISA
jgi:hypothetical protein